MDELKKAQGMFVSMSWYLMFVKIKIPVASHSTSHPTVVHQVAPVQGTLCKDCLEKWGYYIPCSFHNSIFLLLGYLTPSTVIHT